MNMDVHEILILNDKSGGWIFIYLKKKKYCCYYLINKNKKQRWKDERKIAMIWTVVKSYRNCLRLQEKCQCDVTELSFLELKDAHQINL